MQLILPLNDMVRAIQNSSIHAVVLSLLKAFDTEVLPQATPRKLQYYGIQGPFFNWFKSFLTQSLANKIH